MSIGILSIAGKLTRGQRSTVKGLDANPCILGCSEPTAIRLSVAKANRPALVVMTKDEEGNKLFALNETGMAVKAILL